MAYGALRISLKQMPQKMSNKSWKDQQIKLYLNLDFFIGYFAQL